MKKFKFLLEQNMFGVCTRLGEVLRFSPSSIRLYFIYASFFTLGSPILIYLVLAFWREVRTHIRRKENPTIWEF